MQLRSNLAVFLIATAAAVVFCSPLTVSARSQSSSSSFADALVEIQKNLNYEFKNIDLLRRAMTHSSYSEENNRDFSILGKSITETPVARKSLNKDVHASSKDLNDKIFKVDTSSVVEGLRIGQSGSSSFSIALETLQKDLNYTFQNIGLLRRAMTHSSYSEENNKAFSILGESLIETTVAFTLLTEDIDLSSKDLNNKISEVSKVDTSCAVDGMRLGLQNVVRVSSNTDSSTTSIVCGAFRAILGAIALDTGKFDDAGNVFWVVHGGDRKAILI